MTKPSPSNHSKHGLVNPEIAPNKRVALQTPIPAKVTAPRFLTHIPEPRWQRVVSLVVALCLAALEIWFLLHRK